MKPYYKWKFDKDGNPKCPSCKKTGAESYVSDEYGSSQKCIHCGLMYVIECDTGGQFVGEENNVYDEYGRLIGLREASL